MIAWIAMAWGQEASCLDDLEPPPDRLSVVWVSPVNRRARRKSLLKVVPTVALREWIAEEQPTVGRLLRYLGMRKRTKEPKRRYKVVVFEVDAKDLCRPVDPGFELTEPIASIWPCEGGKGKATRWYSGCGYTIDQKTKNRGADTYRVPWSDAANRGFCVFPAQRFVEEAGR